MHDVEVTARQNSSPVKQTSSGKIIWSTQQLTELPKILGNADPIHYAQMLPGIQTTGEYRSGVFIQGCDNGHSTVTIGGVPIYNVNHLLGIFSTFNASHFPTLQLDKAPINAQSGNKIGGSLTMDIPTQVDDTPSGDFSAGLISAQGTLRLPLGTRTQLTLSGRLSYLNLLYSHWLKMNDMQLNYSFYDANVTLSHQLNDQHTLCIDYYGGGDHGGNGDIENTGDLATALDDKWGNQMAAVHHLYDGGNGWRMHNTLYFTHYSNYLKLNMQELAMELPSSITDYGLKNQTQYKRFEMGAEAIFHRFEPQHMLTQSSYVKQTSAEVQHTLEAALWAEYTQPIVSYLNFKAGLRAIAYGSGTTGYFYNLDPSASLTFNNGLIQANLGYALKHQYAFQTGFSDIGFPTECWVSANQDLTPQYSHIGNAGISAYLFGRRYRVTVDLFYRKLEHQAEYIGTYYDLFSSDYNIKDHMAKGKGENYGYSLMLNKCTGKLNGWINYTYTRANRTYHTGKLEGTYPANHHRPHELDAVLTYSFNRHVSAGATYVYASGTPFTAARSIMIINQSPITQYGEHNANRLKPYMRLDLSVNYKWRGRHGQEHGINLSAYNATAHTNELYYYVTIFDDYKYTYKPSYFVLDVLPSVSYFLKF